MTRVELLRNNLPQDVCGAVIATGTNRAYLSGLHSSAGTLLVLKDAAYFIIDSRYIEVAKKKVQGAEVILQGELGKQLSELCEKHGAKLLLCEQELTIAEYESLRAGVETAELCADARLSDIIKGMRAIKSEEEVQRIRAAQAITDGAFSDILGYIKPGLTEKQIAAQLEYCMRSRGADGFAFDTIVVSGENSSMPHGVPGDRKVREGDFITMDFGAVKDGYCSDMTRTVAVGQVSEQQKRVYDTVLRAHLESAAAAKAGITGKELDSVARDIIYGAGYEGYFGHSLGHSLGMDVHEMPGASPRYDKVLPAGTIMTIEPGIYLEGRFGVRIENMILITEEGSVNLTDSPRELIVL